MLHSADLVRTIQPDDFQLPPDINTNGRLINIANSLLRPKHSQAVFIYMICDVVQCLITFFACAYVLFKKGRMRNVKLLTLRRSPYGTFIVPNAICVLLAGVCVHLLTWAGFCSWIVWVQSTDHPLVDWLWFIPYPWLPLALCSFYSAYGFVITCSPRSPISNLGGKGRKQGSALVDELSWIYLPIPHSAVVMNTFMVGIGVFMVIFNTIVQSMNGVQRSLTHKAGHDIYEELLRNSNQLSPEWLAQPPTEERLSFLRIAWADGLNVYRNCCLALSSYMAIIALILFMLIFYAIPNQIFLMNHLCRIFPDEIPTKYRRGSVLANLRMLYWIGWPRNLKGSSYSAFKKTWMMTMVGHSQSILLIGGVVAFAVPPYYLFFIPWSNAFRGKSSDHQVMFILAYTISVAFITAGWITGLSATLTFDDIFRAVSGIGNNPADAATTCSQSGSISVPRRSYNVLRKFTGTNLSISPSSPRTVKGGPRSPTSPQSPGLLRPIPSFTPSESECEKTTFETEAFEENGHKVLVVTETTVRVDHDDVDLEACAADPESIAMSTHPFRSQFTPPSASQQYGFLSRKKKEDS